MKRLVLSEDAADDLAEIGDYISLDNPERAFSFVDELQAKAAQAAERPQSFPAREDLGPGVRSALHRAYLILFIEVDEEVRVLRIVSGRRDLTRMKLN